MLGDASVALAGGAESMSNGGMVIKGLRWGHKMGGTETVDLMQAALQDPFGHGAMGVTGENVAERYNVTREDQDNFALTVKHVLQRRSKPVCSQIKLYRLKFKPEKEHCF